MKITLESTDRILDVTTHDRISETKARIWEGETADGIKVFALILEIAVHKSEDQEPFEAELLAAKHREPTAIPWPLRFFID